MVETCLPQPIAKPGFTLRLATNDPGDASAFCSLFNSLYARRVDADYYRWQFFQTPWPSRLILAFTDDGDLVGTYGFHLLGIQPSGRSIARAIDIMIAPRYQGTGLFRVLANFAAHQVAPFHPIALDVLANARAEAAHVYGLGWRRVSELANYTRSTADLSGDIRGGVCFELQSTIQDTDNWTFMASKCAPVNDTSHLSLAFIQRTEAFLRWRFSRNPWYRYELYSVSRAGEQCAFVALKVFQDPVTGRTSGDVVDLFWAPAGYDAVADILRFAVTRFFQKGVTDVTTWLQTNTLLDEVGDNIGFVRTGQTRFMCSKVLDERYRRLERAAHWFITMTDAEIY